jgi:hypothetical protein
MAAGCSGAPGAQADAIVNEVEADRVRDLDLYLGCALTEQHCEAAVDHRVWETK